MTDDNSNGKQISTQVHFYRKSSTNKNTAIIFISRSRKNAITKPKNSSNVVNNTTATIMITRQPVKSFNAFVAFWTEFPFVNRKTSLEKSNLDGVNSEASGKSDEESVLHLLMNVPFLPPLSGDEHHHTDGIIFRGTTAVEPAGSNCVVRFEHYTLGLRATMRQSTTYSKEKTKPHQHLFNLT
jgi:hypothetical protein